MPAAFNIAYPPVGSSALVVSVPHCGTLFPEELKEDFRPEMTRWPDDTDWFVDQLYDFAPSMGFTLVTAVFSRWVIDLNRDPANAPLYSDGRIITGLCPVTDFLGNSLYRDGRKEVAAEERDRRVRNYFQPYHESLSDEISRMKAKFGKVLLWDCHSIRRVVPTIRKEKFPDLILGSADGRSADVELIDAALHELGRAGLTLQHNDPFKGGYITRHYGRPPENVHALQLEMTKVNYMDDGEIHYDAVRAAKIREVLKRTLAALAELISR